MTKRYKEMEEEYTKKIKMAEQRVEDQNAQKKKLQEDIDRALKEKERKLKEKEENIADLKKTISEMSSDFATMLKETLRKMHERVDFANQTWEGEEIVKEVQADFERKRKQ